MYKILFVCHGNICRSPMAESVFTHTIQRRGLAGKVEIASAAARTDAIGCQPHRGTREILQRKGIPLVPHVARLMTVADGEYYDLLLGMDEWNVQDMKRIVGEKYADKVKMMLDFSDRPRAIADPWYTGNFDETFRDVVEGCEALADYLEHSSK